MPLRDHGRVRKTPWILPVPLTVPRCETTKTNLLTCWSSRYAQLKDPSAVSRRYETWELATQLNSPVWKQEQPTEALFDLHIYPTLRPLTVHLCGCLIRHRCLDVSHDLIKNANYFILAARSPRKLFVGKRPNMRGKYTFPPSHCMLVAVAVAVAEVGVEASLGAAVGLIIRCENRFVALPLRAAHNCDSIWEKKTIRMEWNHNKRNAENPIKKIIVLGELINCCISNDSWAKWSRATSRTG